MAKEAFSISYNLETWSERYPAYVGISFTDDANTDLDSYYGEESEYCDESSDFINFTNKHHEEIDYTDSVVNISFRYEDLHNTTVKDVIEDILDALMALEK